MKQIDAIIMAASRASLLSRAALLRKQRHAGITCEWRAACYAVAFASGIRLSAISRHFSLHHTTVLHHLRRHRAEPDWIPQKIEAICGQLERLK